MKMIAILLPTATGTKYFHFRTAGMGCSNSGAAWCRASDEVLKEVPEVYKGVNDCLLQADLIPKLRKFFQAARQGTMKFSRKKIQVGQEVEFGGYQICANSGTGPVQRPLPRKVKVIQEYPAPQNEAEMRRFLGLCVQFLKFFPDLSHMTKSLREKLKKFMDYTFGPWSRRSSTTSSK